MFWQHTKLQELHLTQTQGVWRHQIWGYPIEDAAPGAELWVWFKPEVKDVDKTWADLVNAVSGLFCSSLNFLDAKSTVAPRWSFKPRGLTPESYAASSDSAAVELTQSLLLVVDATINNNRQQDWSLRKVFGQPLTSQCPLASSSRVFVDMTDNLEGKKFTLSPQPTQQQEFLRGGKHRQFSIYEVGEFTSIGKALNIAAQHESPVQYGMVSAPPVYAHRYITGYGLENGGISCHIFNTIDAYIPVVYMDTLPCLAPMSVTKVSFQFERAFLKWTEYPPDANHGFYINSAVISTILPTASHFTSLPLNASTIVQILNDSSTQFFLRLHTESLLVSLPTPDFSMPYNVICLACTVVAVAFGSVHNLTTRRFVLLDPATTKGLLARLKGLLSFRRKKAPQTPASEETESVNVKSSTEQKETNLPTVE
ncbi:hypothetical protein C0Q70_19224 [Pomacea canaliculata]|uniref:GPI transamidase component PIG-T n=1 Tax=Pomacea canaliculata TaxID=400727 RepID=A0A2T7NIT0_POMCA|nr:hypothetical protein C0Q70_19224 [Pomacea canaliculata]